MKKILTSWAILMSSVQLMGQHKKLAWFPLLNFIALIGIVLFFAMPVFTQMTVFNLSEKLPEFVEAMKESAPERRNIPEQSGFEGLKDAMDNMAETRDAGENSHTFVQTSFWTITVLDKVTPTYFLLIFYLISMFLGTFVNVAFYHEIMKAFNGEQVSLGRGFRFASTKLKAIVLWSLLAGVVGAIIQQIQENVGFVGRWITGLIGIAWSVASVFAIPVIIREEQQSNPVDYLKKSAVLIQKTWGEGLTGLASISVVVFLLIAGTLISGFFLSIMTTPWLMVLLICPAILILLYVSGVARNIYFCGLYVYASEGVAPGNFDAQIFDHAWKVKQVKKNKK